jgi:competence protein CoiA
MTSGGRMRYAIVDGQKQLPSKGTWGSCPSCNETVVSKCGPLVVHHWAHKAGADCDSWSEPIGRWHLEWQSEVKPDFVEVVVGPHRADLIGKGDYVIELQHSPIPKDDIRAREEFYGNMVWVFDATERFEMVATGKRVFFSFGRTKHIGLCAKPIFLDFGSTLVEVESLTEDIAHMNGYGWARTREWFSETFLSDRLVAGKRGPRSTSPKVNVRWSKNHRYDRTKHMSKWMDPQQGEAITIPKDTNCLPLTWRLKNPGEDWENEWERLISNHPGLSIGWTKNDLVNTRDILAAKIMILDGYLRLMPSSVDAINVKATVSEVRTRLQRIDEHIAAGRLPILKDSTKQQLMKAAEDHERRTYGRLLSEPVQSRKKDDSQKSLFDDM